MKRYDKENWVVFINLVNTFDTIHRTFLFKILGKFSISQYLTNLIEKLCNNFKIQIQVGKYKESIDHITIVNQGDYQALILFIIVIQFIAELVEKIEGKQNEN